VIFIVILVVTKDEGLFVVITIVYFFIIFSNFGLWIYRSRKYC